MQIDRVYGKQMLCKALVTVDTVQYSPFTTVNSFVYFHNVPCSHNSSIFCISILGGSQWKEIKYGKRIYQGPTKHHVMIMTNERETGCVICYRLCLNLSILKS
jgi:hypothetical protein